MLSLTQFLLIFSSLLQLFMSQMEKVHQTNFTTIKYSTLRKSWCHVLASRFIYCLLQFPSFSFAVKQLTYFIPCLIFDLPFQPVVLYICFEVFDFCYFNHIQFPMLWWTLPFAVPIIIITEYINIFSHTSPWSFRKHRVESGLEYMPLKPIWKPKQIFFSPTVL